ncbi:MAG: sensor histidine kinase [Flavobacterium sp.]
MKKYNISPKKIFYFIFWTTLFISVWFQILDPNNPFEWLLPTFFFLILSIGVSHYVSDYELPKALKKGETKKFIVKALFFTLLLSLILALYFTFFPSYINEKEMLLQEVQMSKQNQFLSQLYRAFPSAMAIITTTCGIRFYEEHHKIEKVNAKLKQEHLEAHLKLLQDQINPHLMFNVLNHIHTLMQSDVELASTVLLKFSDILRYQLYECNHKMVLLHREIQYLQDLVAIEQIRWGDELEVDCQWNISNRDLVIAPLLLVPLIENAFKHVSRLPNTKGYIIINFTEKNNTLNLYIENSYSDKYKLNKTEGGIGVINVQERLQMQYPNTHTFNISHSDEKHIVELTVNLKEN